MELEAPRDAGAVGLRSCPSVGPLSQVNLPHSAMQRNTVNCVFLRLVNQFCKRKRSACQYAVATQRSLLGLIFLSSNDFAFSSTADVPFIRSAPPRLTAVAALAALATATG